jgi:hypothetical protein
VHSFVLLVCVADGSTGCLHFESMLLVWVTELVDYGGRKQGAAFIASCLIVQ